MLQIIGQTFSVIISLNSLCDHLNCYISELFITGTAEWGCVCVGGGGGVGGSTGWNEKLHNGSNIRDQSDDLSHYEWIFYHENE